jgi:hypothetical protein
MVLALARDPQGIANRYCALCVTPVVFGRPILLASFVLASRCPGPGLLNAGSLIPGCSNRKHWAGSELIPCVLRTKAKGKINKPRNTHHTTNMSTIDSAQQEMPTQSEENNQVIQHRYDALGRGDTDALFASMHKGDPQQRDRRVLRNIIFITSTGLAMILAAIFATVLELPDFWQDLWLAICISFTLLFFVGLLCFGSELS